MASDIQFEYGDLEDRYEHALDGVIATCGGDVRSALKALLAANEFLENEISALLAVHPAAPWHRSARISLN